jgi:hypothetical protein
MGRVTTTAHARAALAALTLGSAALGPAACGGGMPRIRASLLPPVVPWAGDSVTLSGRRFHRAEAASYELYVQSGRQLPAMRDHLARASQEFARHFGPPPRVAVLLFDAPADPHGDFDFAPFVARRTQVLAFVRGRDAQKAGTLGVDERLLAARLAELYLAAYADSVGRRLAAAGVAPLAAGERALDRLPHWFTEAVVSRVAGPEAVERGVTFVRQNRPRLMPLRRLFATARLGMPFWSELAHREGVVRAYTEQTAQPTPPPLLAAESTVFGEFLVSRHGPTYLQALAEELLAGRTTEDAVAALPGGEEPVEAAWREWLSRGP